MAKTPRSRNADDKVIQGKELDAYIKAELQAMVQEGLEKSPIQPSTLHARLKAKGIVKGGIREGANKQVISSQADSLIKISRIWADFFPANTSNQPI
ncbi:hypothetical protein AH0328V1_2407 [Enterobacter cloacae]|nr:hypothetical protein AH0328V1_2407 [Enterobacter cloacae]CAH3299609.1 hypothetical protein AH0328V1_2407 [Enterobacter cloacae]